MTTPGEEPQEHPPVRPGSYAEIAPGVPRYGQYAPAGWEPPQDVKDAQAGLGSPSALPPAPSYPGFQGNMAANPAAGGAGESTSPLAPPARVILATRLIMAAGVLQLIGLVLWAFAMTTPAGQELIREAVEQSLAVNPQAAAEVSAQALFTMGVGFMALIQAACAAGYFWIAAKLRRGRNWARTTALVLAIVSIALVPEGGSYSYYSAARIILGLVAVFMLFRSPAKEFFLAHKARKASSGR